MLRETHDNGILGGKHISFNFTHKLVEVQFSSYSITSYIEEKIKQCMHKL